MTIHSSIESLLTIYLVYQHAGASTISVLAWLFGDPTIYTISMKVARQVVSMRGKFEKTAETTEIMTSACHSFFLFALLAEVPIGSSATIYSRLTGRTGRLNVG